MVSGFGWIDLSPHSKVAGFVDHLRQGRLMASRCSSCGVTALPPRADCPKCRGAEFEFVEQSGEGRLATYCGVEAAPAGFEAIAPYTLGVVDLDEGGRLLAWIGQTIPADALRIGLPVRVVPCTVERGTETRVLYTVERREQN